MTDVQRPTRPRWRRDAAVPRALIDLRGPTSGDVGLPPELFWSGPSPRHVRWDLADPDRRRDLYEIILVNGTLDDITRLVDGPSLVEVWDRMYLPPHVRSAWRPIIDASPTAA